MVCRILAIVSVMCLGMQSSAALAAFSWPKLPVACLPERAVTWVDGKSEAKQAACHCPPTDMCPTTYEEYQDNTTAQMPMAFVLRCCPKITNPNPTCPDGSPVPASGECSVPTSCPTKFYPSLAQQGITGSTGAFSKKYSHNGKNYDFRKDCGLKQNGFCIESDTMYGGTDYIYVLDKFYGLSLRTKFDNWVYGDIYRNFGGTWGGQGSDAYRELTDKAVTGKVNVATLLPTLNSDEFTWFGISIAKIEKLPDNLAHKDLVSALGSQSIIKIGEGLAAQDFSGVSTKNPEFFKTCRKVLGEYVTLHTENIGGNSCAYLECRYVWAWAGESCLSGAAEVTLSDGTKKAASELAVGDRVKTEGGEGKVTATNRYQSGLRVLYGINGGGALLTGDHPLRTTEGWKVITDEAAALYADKPGFAKTKLAVGDELITEQGKVVVKSVDRFAKVDPVSTYNIRVEGGKGFYADGFEVKGFEKMEMQYK